MNQKVSHALRIGLTLLIIVMLVVFATKVNWHSIWASIRTTSRSMLLAAALVNILSIVVKGIQTVEDAIIAADAGVEAIALSNHGGRQLDRAPTPLERLPEVVDAVGDRAEVYLDGGVLSGGDVVAAVALGARAVGIGRAYLYGLMAGGERGVQRATQILAQEIETTMALVGVTRVAELRPEQVTLRPG